MAHFEKFLIAAADPKEKSLRNFKIGIFFWIQFELI
tara:strand:- start:167 stop:274 length:108 start_codon:yes stop_codon:yes gene_type:complete